MPPNSEQVEIHQSSLGFKYPHNRDIPLKIGDLWLEGKRHDDDTDGLWRIHDDLYDLTDFVDKHPGGAFWLQATKGTDITEAFEAHHLTKKPDQILQKYHAKKAERPRNSPFTFKEDGFYRTLKRNVVPILEKLPKKSLDNSLMMTDALLVATYASAIAAAAFWSYTLAILSGWLLALTMICSHNYLHMKDNFRMYYWDLTGWSSREFRIIHALSHHLYTNTIIDLEISAMEPLIEYMPKKKSGTVKYLSWIYVFFLWVTFLHQIVVKKILYFLVQGETVHLRLTDLLPLTIPLSMYMLTDQTLLGCLGLWMIIMMANSAWFGMVGFNAAHHHPEIFHDGDTPRPDDERDWGISQLDAVMDRTEIRGNHFLVLTNFGDHALHHLFPTLDHGTLEQLYPVFEETMKQFNIDLRVRSQFEMIAGQFMQLSREKPNPNPPDLLKKKAHL